MTTESNGNHQGNGAEEVFAITDEVTTAVDEVLAGITVEMEIDFSPDPSVPTAQIMRMRGAVHSAEQMMKGGMSDLVRGANLEGFLQFAIGLFTMGGELLLAAVGDALDDELTERGMPLVSLYPVESSNIAAMGWGGGPENPQLAVVEFTNGSLYAYHGISESLFSEWWEAPSKGQFLASEIRGNFEYLRLDV